MSELEQPPAIAAPHKSPSGRDKPIYEILPNGNVRIIYSPPTTITPVRANERP
jgi:hypothetical protein